MCGFIGFISDINDKRVAQYEEKFNHYLIELNNRGPDYKETKKIILKNKIIHVGFSRLAIQDLNPKSNKIFFNQDALLLFNGEIYNHKTLKEKYLNLEQLSTSTDTEVLFNLLLKKGTKIVNEISGIFSFIFFDLKKNTLECVRDFTGTKPLYYLMQNNNFFFSSEAWFLYSLTEKKINKKSLNFFLNFGFTPEENTLIDEVKKIKPRNILKLNYENFKSEKRDYFNINENKNSEFISEDELNNSLEDIIKNNLITDTKIGTFLSGGLDSSIVTAIAKKYNNKIEGFTTVFLPEKKYEKFNQDYIYAKKLSDDLNIKLNVNFIDNISSTLDDFYKITNYLDEPVSNLNFLNTYWQSKHARSLGFKVILTGDGSDELFCGYDRYNRIFLSNFLKFLNKYNQKICKYNSIRKEKIPLFFYSIFNNTNLANLLNENKFDENFGEKDLLDDVNFDSNVDYINYFDFKYWLTNESNYKLDKCTMINSVEARVPFQDKSLIKKLFFIKNSKKFSFFNRKFLLKKNKIVPKYIQNRKKTGWFTPDRIFLDTNLKKIRKDIFQNNKIKNQGIFNEENLEHFLNSYDVKGYLIKKEVTTIILFQIWYNKIISLK